MDTERQIGMHERLATLEANVVEAKNLLEKIDGKLDAKAAAAAAVESRVVKIENSLTWMKAIWTAVQLPVLGAIAYFWPSTK